MALSSGTKMSLRNALASNPAYEDLTADLAAIAKLPDGMVVNVLEEQVTLTNAVEDNLSTTIPANAIILSVAANLDTLVVGDASGDNGLVKVGIGVTADPDKYGLTPDLLKNSKSTWAITPTRLTAAEQITVKAANTSGVAVTEKFVAGGKVTVRVVYLTATALPNAA